VFKLLKEAIRTGSVTERYPFGPFEPSPGFRGKVEYDPKTCMACAACTMVCPSNALSMQTDPEANARTWSYCLGQCIFCARCQEVCPTGAIWLSERFELAVTSRADLFTTASFELTACRGCGQRFAPAKEVEYLLSIQLQAGLAPDKVEERREILETCPSCKRHRDVIRVAQAEPRQRLQTEAVR
jgi:formate hydrogenlyase subunit 6/NADH:ubiquinone oxidoreductase subunit I